MKLEKFKVTFADVFGALMDIAFMSIRPILFWFIWNYGIAFEESTHIPKLDFVQVICIIILFNILITYVPISVKSNSSE